MISVNTVNLALVNLFVVLFAAAVVVNRSVTNSNQTDLASFHLPFYAEIFGTSVHPTKPKWDVISVDAIEEMKKVVTAKAGKEEALRLAKLECERMDNDQYNPRLLKESERFIGKERENAMKIVAEALLLNHTRVYIEMSEEHWLNGDYRSRCDMNDLMATKLGAELESAGFKVNVDTKFRHISFPCKTIRFEGIKKT